MLSIMKCAWFMAYDQYDGGSADVWSMHRVMLLIVWIWRSASIISGVFLGTVRVIMPVCNCNCVAMFLL